MAGESHFIDPSGEVVAIPEGQEATAARSGYVKASPKQVEDFQRRDEAEKKYGGALGALEAGVAAAMRAGTFGVSDLALTKSGFVSPETLSSLKEVQPLATGLGTLGGIALPALVSGGSSLLAKGATKAASGAVGAAEAAALGKGLQTSAGVVYSPVQAVSALGKATEAAAASVLPAGESLGAQIAAKAAAMGAGSAVEGAAYGLGNVVSEVALGDNPHLTAESALAEVGLSALLGAGMGGVLGATEAAAPAAIQRAREALSGVFGKAQSTAEGALKAGEAVTQTGREMTTVLLENKQALDAMEKAIPGVGRLVSEAKPEVAEFMLKNASRFEDLERAFPGTTAQLSRADLATAEHLLKDYPKIITDPKARVAMAQELTGGMQKMVDETNALLKKANTEILPAEAKQLVQGVDSVPVAKRYGETLEKIETAIKDMRAEPELHNGSRVRFLEKVRDGLIRDAEKATVDPAEAFVRFRTLRKSLDEAIPYGKDAMALSFSDKNTIKVLQGLRAEVKGVLTDTAVFGQAAARRASLDEAESTWLRLMDRKGDFTRRFMGPDGKVKPTKLNTWLNQMADARGADFLDTWGRTMEAAKKVIGEVSESNKVAQVAGVDKAALESLVNRAAELTADARQRAAVTQLKNQLDPRMSWGSMPVVPGAAPHLTEKVAAAEGALNVVGNLAGVGNLGSVLKTVTENTTRVDKAVRNLATLERLAQRVDRAVETGASTLVRGGVKAGKVVRGEVAAGLAHSFGAGKVAAERTYQRRVEQIQKFSHPGNLQEALAKGQGDLAEHAPDTSLAMGTITARGISFLASKIPQHPPAGPLAAKWKPTTTEMATFGRYYEAVQSPLSILKQASAGTLTSEGVEAVREVYPQLFAKIQRALLEKTAAQSGKIPHTQRMMLSLLLGQDVDGSRSSAAVQANQQALSAPETKQAPPSGNPAALTLSSRSQTPNQAAQTRR